MKVLRIPLALLFAALLAPCVISPAAAANGSIIGAFSNLLSGTTSTANGPGYYQSDARGVFVLGGAEVRFPTSTSSSLITVNLPYIYAGCGGISANFGGFSMVSGQKIAQLIKDIAQNSVGMVTMLAIKELCPQCADVIGEMQTIAQKAASLAINSCQMSNYLVNEGASLLKSTHLGDEIQQKVASYDNANGLSSGWLQDMQNGVSDVSSELSQWDSAIQTAETGAQKSTQAGLNTLCHNSAECNTTWTLLGNTDLDSSDTTQAVWDKTLLMNIIGTKIVCPESSCGPEFAAGYVLYPSTLAFFNKSSSSQGTLNNVYRLFMCGLNWSTADSQYPAAQQVVNYYCSGADPAAAASFYKINVWQCKNIDMMSNPDIPCLNLVRVPLGESLLALQGGEGWLPFVASTLAQGVQNVINGTPQTNNVIALMSIVPAPLYQAINDAAVFPSASVQIISSMSLYSANLMADSEIRHIAREAGRVQSGPNISRAQVEALYEFLGGMVSAAKSNNQSILTSIQMQQTLMQQVREINSAVANETITQGLLGASNFAIGVSTP